MLEDKSWVQLGVFQSKTRIEILELLLKYEISSLSEICKKLKEIYDLKITLPGLLRHMHELEKVGIVRQESGGFLPTPDSRKRVYIIQGKDRVKEILQSWEKLNMKLTAGIAFNELTKVARNVFATGTIPQPKDRKILERMIEKCESEEVKCHLMDDEMKKLKFWKMMLSSTLEL
jgi:DNA-binding transcriptional ArsR family regulator